MSFTIYRPGTAGEPSLAERMGYKKTDKLLMIHADDIGMCHSVNMATIEAMEKGVVSSAAIMVPCPWFPEIAEYCRKNPDADYGLHLTLTSEWRNYRWTPLQSRQQAPGLYDQEGFIHRSVEGTVKYASADEVEREMRLQVARALEFGIKPSRDFFVTLGILAMNRDEDIDIQQDHRPSMQSSSADEEDKSTPGCNPSP